MEPAGSQPQLEDQTAELAESEIEAIIQASFQFHLFAKDKDISSTLISSTMQTGGSCLSSIGRCRTVGCDFGDGILLTVKTCFEQVDDAYAGELLQKCRGSLMFLFCS